MKHAKLISRKYTDFPRFLDFLFEECANPSRRFTLKIAHGKLTITSHGGNGTEICIFALNEAIAFVIENEKLKPKEEEK